MIISAFPACGKSFFVNHCSEHHSYKDCCDSDSSHFHWMPPETIDPEARKPNPNWVADYCDHIEKMSKQHQVVFVSSHEDVLRELTKRKITYALIMPPSDGKAEWIERCRRRGNTAAFIKRISDNWDAWVNAMPYAEYATYVWSLDLGEYITEDLLDQIREELPE